MHSESLPVMYGVLIRLVIIDLFVKTSGDETWVGVFYLNMILNLQRKSLDCSELFHFLRISNSQTNL